MINFKQYVESVQGKIVVIYPGRFQPAHIGHYSLYESLVREHPGADVYVATSGKVDDKSPFTFEERKRILEFLGVPGNRIINVINPYKAEEITKKYNPAVDHVIFALSEKDSERINFKPKKDGTPAYFIQYNSQLDLLPFEQHGYIETVQVTTFSVLGVKVQSASQIRELYKSSDMLNRKQIITDLYGRFDQGIYDLFNQKLG